jgi:hypothetical protein
MGSELTAQEELQDSAFCAKLISSSSLYFHLVCIQKPRFLFRFPVSIGIFHHQEHRMPMVTQKSFKLEVTSRERVTLAHSSLHTSQDQTENWNMVSFYTLESPHSELIIHLHLFKNSQVVIFLTQCDSQRRQFK